MVLVGLFSSFVASAAEKKTKSETSIEPVAASERRYLLDPVELTPVSGFTIVNSSVGFNLGAYGAYPMLSNAPLYAEPSSIVGLYSGRAMFNFGAGARYDISIPDTKVRPFARVALGPTFQTSGSVAVFNASMGGGALIPVGRNMELRAEASIVDIDGNAGFQLLGGVSL